MFIRVFLILLEENHLVTHPLLNTKSYLDEKIKKNLLLRTCSQELKVIVETFLDTEVTLVWRLN